MLVASFVQSLPAAAHPYLNYQLDRDNPTDRDLKEIANHMENWESNLATHLKLTKSDTERINRKHNVDPASQRSVKR